MRSTIKVGTFTVRIRNLRDSLVASVDGLPECTHIFRKEELHNIGDEMRVIIFRHLISKNISTADELRKLRGTGGETPVAISKKRIPRN